MSKTLILKPRISEKAYGLTQGQSTYVFTVPLDASKQLIAQAVESQFEVGVVDVNTVRIKGKAKRTVRKRTRPVAGSQSNFKKAYVTLKSGDQIAVFNTEDAEAPKEPTPSEPKKPETKEAKSKRRFGRNKA